MPGDKAGLTEFLQFINNWLTRDHDRPGVPPAGVGSNRACNARQSRNHLDQFIFLPCGSGGESLLAHSRTSAG